VSGRHVPGEAPQPAGEQRQPERHVDEERGAPAVEFDQHAAQAGTSCGRHRRRRAPYAHGRGPTLGRSLEQHEAERRRDHAGRGGALDRPERDQRLDIRCDRTDRGGGGERAERDEEEPASPEDVGQPARRRQQRRQQHGVRADHPGQGRH